MTVSEFIEWLKDQPQDATVQVLQHSDSHSQYMQGGECNEVEFSGNDGVDFEYTDLRENPFVKSDSSHFNQHYLLIGAHL